MKCDYNSTLAALHVINNKKNISEIFGQQTTNPTNMAEFKKAVQQYQDLSKEWAKGRSRDNAKVRLLLTLG